MAHKLISRWNTLSPRVPLATRELAPTRTPFKISFHGCKSSLRQGPTDELDSQGDWADTRGRRLDQPAACPNPQLSRRAALIAIASTAVVCTGSAEATEESSLPKEYRRLIKRLADDLSEAIEVEASGASEPEVRRKADPAKENVREFVRKWRDNPRVSSDRSHLEVKEALAELGEFYLAYGQRTKLSQPVRESVLKHLTTAKSSLPEEPKKEGGGILGGLF